MSLFSKFTSIFHSNQTTNASTTPPNTRLELVLAPVLKPSLKFDMKGHAERLFQFILEKDEHIDQLFQYISQPKKGILPLSVVQLLSTIHQLFQFNDIVYDVAVKVRETKMQWSTYSKENWSVDEIFTEPNREPNHQQFMTEIDSSIERPIQVFVTLYFGYLQRLAANIDLYKAVGKGLYPYVNEKEQVEPKLMFLWHYKIQNLLNAAISLLKYDIQLAEIQKQIYYDVWKFQRFLCCELPKVVDYYATLPNSDTLSLYEIYTESNRHYELMRQFQLMAKLLTCKLDSILVPDPVQAQISNSTLQDFLGFVSKLKVLNQIQFKKSLKVPNKQNPCMGIPTKNPNALHIRSSSGRMIKMEHESEESEKKSDTSINELQDQVEDLSDTKKKNKKIHLRGQSTFQMN